MTESFKTEGGESCRPSNSPVGTMSIPNASTTSASCRPSNSPVGTISSYFKSVCKKSCRPSNSPVGTMSSGTAIDTCASCRPSNSPVGTIACLNDSTLGGSCRPSNSPVGTMPKPKHPLRTGGVLVWTEIKMRFGAGKVALRAPFSENRSQKKGLPANTRGADGLTLRVIA